LLEHGSSSRMRRPLALFFITPLLSSAAPPVDFARDVLPILSDACFHCHGPDEKERKAKLRLDTKEGLYRTEDGITVVAPGKPDDSDLVVRVESKDPDEIMPPPKANRQLNPDEIAILKRWVGEGAPFGRHWAFEPMKKLAGSGIDKFVETKLEEEKLTFSPEADRERLIRRVTLDLTGLPPTLAEIDAFIGDQSPMAFEKVVDRLLASPRFGERLATEWLDVARFADTHGYQMDATREMWPWRDWVIKAFNENMPFDRFTKWQLAGDLLPNATKEQRLATAFNRHHMQNEEGGIVEEEFRTAYVVDRVNTFATAFLGLTTECARCHDHKYDPISQRDFYSLFAFFQNIDEAGQNPYTGFVHTMPEPTLLLSNPEQDNQLSSLSAKIAAKEAEETILREAERPRFAEWLQTKPQRLGIPGGLARYELGSLANNGVPDAWGLGKVAKAHEGPKRTEGAGEPGVELDGESGFQFPGVGHFNRADEFSIAIRIKPPKHSARAVVLHHTKAPTDAASRGYEILLENGRVAFGLHHFWPANSIKLVTRQPILENEWAHIVVAYDGSSRASGAHIYINGQRMEVDVIKDNLTKDISYGKGEPELTIGYRFRDSGFKDGAVDYLEVYSRELTAPEIAQLAGAGIIAPDETLFETFLATASEAGRNWRKDLRELRDQHRQLVEPIPEIMVMRELPQPKKAYVLKRGAYDAQGEEVAADTPHALPAFPKGAPRNRLGLTQWLLDPEHPLMARVTVNRLWQMMFGRGLVETAENFGTQGSQPTHPELLDWMARDFIASGWDVKATFKKIALSRTYRQSSKAAPEMLVRDPQNLLLARGPARRLSAEMLRDQALSASRLLVDKIGGPSVKPYQPPGLWEEIAMGKPSYGQGKGDDLHRRSLYTFWKRTVPPPVMITFDAADRSNCAVRRQSTSTPLQALALLNDVQLVEAARFIAQRMLREGGSTRSEQIRWAFRTITGRIPSARESEILARLYDDQHELFAKDAEATGKLLNFGETKNDPSIAGADLAAATIMATAVLNHDEAMMRR
jgi:hypothetical protein